MGVTLFFCVCVFDFLSRSSADSLRVLWTEHFPEASCQAMARKWMNKDIVCKNDNEI